MERETAVSVPSVPDSVESVCLCDLGPGAGSRPLCHYLQAVQFQPDHRAGLLYQLVKSAGLVSLDGAKNGALATV